jgi:hypothetical protein
MVLLPSKPQSGAEGIVAEDLVAVTLLPLKQRCAKGEAAEGVAAVMMLLPKLCVRCCTSCGPPRLSLVTHFASLNASLTFSTLGGQSSIWGHQ